SATRQRHWPRCRLPLPRRTQPARRGGRDPAPLRRSSERAHRRHNAQGGIVTRTSLAPPTGSTRTDQPAADEHTLILRLTEIVEQLARQQTAAVLELRCFTPAQAADILGKNEHWVLDGIREGRLPHTRVGKSP